MSSALISIAGGSLLLSLIFCMIIGLILGMGLTVTPSYVILAALIAPVLTSLGLMPQQAHLFCFYYACLCGITPPGSHRRVCSGRPCRRRSDENGPDQRAAGGFALYHPLHVRLCTAADLNRTVPELIQCVITSSIGIYAFSIAAEGWLFKKVPIVWRVIIGAAALCAIHPAR